MDGIREQLVRKEKTASDGIKKMMILLAALLLGAVLVIAAAHFTNSLLITDFAAVGGILVLWGGWALSGLLNVEYEYAIYGSEMQIDKIYNKRFRRKFCELDLKKAEGFYKGERQTDRSEIFACGEGERYCIEYNDGSYGRAVLIFTPDEKTLEAVVPYLPRLS